MDADDFDRVAGVDDALLDAAGGDGAAAGDREDVLDRHQERLVELAHRLRDVGVQRRGQLEDLLLVGLVAFERLQRRAGDERDVVAGEVVLGEQLAHLDLDQFEQLLVVDHVGLVEEHHDVGDADLTGEQDVLARLRHRAVGGGDHQDRAVHLGGARDHVLHVVGVARAVDVRVVAVLGLVLDVRGGDRDPAFLLLGRVVDLLEAAGFGAALLCQHRRDGSGQRRLAMVDVTDGPDVDVRLVALELLLRHFCSLLYRLVCPPLCGGRTWEIYLNAVFLDCCVLRRCLFVSRACSSGRDRLARPRFDDLLGDVRRDLLVGLELHRVVGPTLRVRAQVGRVAEHLATAARAR